jgi:hypothetical protein
MSAIRMLAHESLLLVLNTDSFSIEPITAGVFQDACLTDNAGFVN